MTTHPSLQASGGGELWLIRAAVVAAGIELVVLRLVTRTAIHIPGISRVESPYRVTAEMGRLAYYVAVVLVVVALGSVLWRGLAAGRFGWNAVAIAWFIGAAGATRLGLTSDSTLAWSVVGSVLMLLPAALRRYQPRMLPILLFGMSFALAGLHAATQVNGFGSILGPAPTGFLPIAEALAVVACIASPMLVRTKVRRAPLLIGAGVALATFMALLASPATVKILLLWNFGLAGYFPAFFYAVAFGALAFTALSSRSTDAPLALGLALLVFGGLGLHSSYQSGLVLLGLVALATTNPTRETAAWIPEASEPRPEVSLIPVAAG